MGKSNEDSNQQLHDVSSKCLGCVSCTTFNILAPIYKRLDGENRESDFREIWVSRNESILDRLLCLKSSLICLQEFWVGNEEFVSMYEKRLQDAGYAIYKLARTNNRGDGLLTAVHQDHFRILKYRELLFHDFGDRVAQLLHVELLVPFSQNQSPDIEKEAIVVNTHLIFPHDSTYCFVRLQQVYKILQHIQSYCNEQHLPPVPIILCGDWNGSNKGHVYKFLHSQGFVSSYDVSHHCTDNNEESQKWVSHHNHRGNICGVDFIWLLNPNKQLKPLKYSFMEAVLGNMRNLLHKVSTEDANAMHFFKSDGNHITYSQFSQSLKELGLCKHESLSDEDIKELWKYLDTDGDGVVDLSDLSKAESLHLQEEENGIQSEEMLTASTFLKTIGFSVKKAMFFPPEVENGMWPENYSLSDHAQLTVEFSLVKMGGSHVNRGISEVDID